MVEQDNANRSDAQNDSFADGGVDDAAWLLADFGPTTKSSPSRDAAAPGAGFPPAVPAGGCGDPPQSSNAGSAHHPAPAVARPPQWMAVGDGFQPLPGSPLLSRADTPQPAAIAIAEPGSSVHAVVGGVIHRSGTGLELRADDGRSFGYRGDAVVRWVAGEGERVPPGAVLGWVSPPPTAGTLSTMTFFLVAADGTAQDPVGWLAGLADPQELGLSGELAGGVDPFLIDLRLAGHLHLDGDVR